MENLKKYCILYEMSISNYRSVKKMDIGKIVKAELSGWKKWEIGWMFFCSAAIIVLSLLLKDNWLGIISALTSTWYALWAGKGKMSCYFFGIINSFCYGLISYNYKLFGEVMLNWGYYLPMMFVGLFFWRKHLDSKQEIYKTKLSFKGRILLVLLAAAGIAAYAVLLKFIGGRTPGLDSLTTVLSVAAMIMTVKRCVEQWFLWTVVNIASIIMWLRVYMQEGGAVASLLMWCIALVNGIIFYVQWSKEVKNG